MATKKKTYKSKGIDLSNAENVLQSLADAKVIDNNKKSSKSLNSDDSDDNVDN